LEGIHSGRGEAKGDIRLVTIFGEAHGNANSAAAHGREKGL